MAEISYRVKDGDTWSSIAYQAYADAAAFEDIVRLNPSQPADGPTPGAVILIPIKTSPPPVTLNTSLRPPWKR